jgi:DNA-binding transcriptional LysR family regulator
VKGLDAWPEEKYQRQARYRVDLLETGLALARRGLGAIFIPRFVAHLHNEESPADRRLVLMDLPRPINSVRREIYIVKRESMLETAPIQRIAKAIRAMCTFEGAEN